MLGVIANPIDEEVAREFFELFKIPWEFWRSGKEYDVVLCADDRKLDGVRTKLLLVYRGEKTDDDTQRSVEVAGQQRGARLSFLGNTLPLYGNAVTFWSERTSPLNETRSGKSSLHIDCSSSPRFARVGYDLFSEVRNLLFAGQPRENAGIPTLDIHIALLRGLITSSGIPLVEIPPAPAGFDFIACLTHDLDHPSIRRHLFDATMFGFLCRATVGSAWNVACGRASVKKLVRNWTAAAKLPLIYLGLAEDFWYQFDRYLFLEQGKPSTFFVIPFAAHPGRSRQGSAPQARAAGYDVSHVAGKISRLAAAGSEIGLHGIDAWTDSAKGREEARRISEVTAKRELGVRMHWLYQDENSFAVLEEAGFSYDSTVGYNETVGYCAGTTQAFKPPRAKHLLELPMHIMDTALFYPSYLGLTEQQAFNRIGPIFDHAARHGGAVTINWHDRSIAPERLWGDFYVQLLADLTARGSWFATAAQCVSWFRKRRSATFETVDTDEGFSVRVVADKTEDTPGLRLRFHPPQTSLAIDVLKQPGETYSDQVFNDSIDASFPGVRFGRQPSLEVKS